jgi:polyphosphate glucokinase
MNVLVIDVGGTNIKLLATGQEEKRKFPSGLELDAELMTKRVKELTGDWSYEAIAIGYPGVVRNGAPITEPKNLKAGWVQFDYEAALGCPVKIMNDAAMQALGSYDSGRMLFLGLGTGLGSTLIVDGHIIPLALGDLPFRNRVFNHYLNRRGLKRLGPVFWREAVNEAAVLLQEAFEADYVVLGGGNADKLKQLPKGVRRGHNRNAFVGGFRMWEEATIAAQPRVLQMA